ncbi:hypothetical protein ACJQWK_02815 [Exserohilum turcicum]
MARPRTGRCARCPAPRTSPTSPTRPSSPIQTPSQTSAQTIPRYRASRQASSTTSRSMAGPTTATRLAPTHSPTMRCVVCCNKASISIGPSLTSSHTQPEIERLDMQHVILTALFHQRNYLAPLKQKRPKRMLDIGCGTGKWCFEMANEFPKCRVEGIDLSPIQPKISCENVDFFMDDINRPEWWHCTQPYDYIHTRMSLGIFRDFREIIQKGFNNLNPGGWMESQEIYSKVYCNDGTMPPDYALLEWTQTEDEAAMRLGRPLRIANKLKRWYEQAGFVDVHEEIFAIPVNSWPKDERMKVLGKWFYWNMCAGVHAWSIEYFVTALGWSPAEVEVYLAHVRTALADKSVHAYYKVYVVWGRKPRADEPPSKTPKPPDWPQPPADNDFSYAS